jgi:processive 1,2-diacylglycerol beta-glucosyltransferase
MADTPRILILTAAFGEGHNSAARNLALALGEMNAVSQVCDPCMKATPRLTSWVNHAYRFVTTHLPQLWALIYRSTDRCDLGRQNSWVIRRVENTLSALILDFKPDYIVSTYPLYPYLLKRIFSKKVTQVMPIFTVVTDSIEINAAWLRAPSDFWFVTDSHTRKCMVALGLPEKKIIETGFPVNPNFSKLIPLSSSACCTPFKILYFPTSKLPFIRRHSRALLDASPSVRLTIILGKNVRLLYSRAREIQKAYPGRVRLIGWSKRVPQFMNQHHLVVGKAGGATVHEAIAARCPMLIHHLVPGQEEGNLRLLETINAGHLAESPAALTQSIHHLLADDARIWRGMKQSLADHNQSTGSFTAAKFILSPPSLTPEP